MKLKLNVWFTLKPYEGGGFFTGIVFFYEITHASLQQFIISSFLVPLGQKLPPYFGHGSEHVRVLSCFPLPMAVEHWPQGFHELQLPCTKKNKNWSDIF